MPLYADAKLCDSEWEFSVHEGLSNLDWKSEWVAGTISGDVGLYPSTPT